MAKNILLVGGGYANVAAAKALIKRYRKSDEVKITLVDRNPFMTCMTELHEVAGWRVEPDSVRIPYAKLFGAQKIDIKSDTITSIDFDKNEAKSALNTYPYDYLILGTGAEPNYFGMKDVEENSFALWSFDDAMRIREHIEKTFEKAVAEPDTAKRKKMFTFVVAGAGFTGIEMAGELLEWRDVMCKKWRIDPSEVKVMVVEALGFVLPPMSEKLRAKASKYLYKHNVEVRLNTAIVGAEPGRVNLKDGSAIETDTFIWTCGVDGTHFADSLSLSQGPFGKDVPEGKRNRRGRILTTPQLASVDYPNVYAVGDNIWFIEDGKPIPQLVESAENTGHCAAHNIMVDIDGAGEKENFKNRLRGNMCSIGGKYGVSNGMGIECGGFMAMAVKHIANLLYFWGIGGVNVCWEYIKHEFLDIPENRSFVWGLGRYKNRFYWSFLLRLWLGVLWLFEGINKIGEGWLNPAVNNPTPSAWLFNNPAKQRGSAAWLAAQAGDATAAVTAASGAGDATAQAVTAASGAATEAVTAASGAAQAAADTVTAASGAAQAVADTVTAASGAAEAVADTVTAASGAAQAVADTVTAASGAVAAAVAANPPVHGPYWPIMTNPVIAKDYADRTKGVANWFTNWLMDGIMAQIPYMGMQIFVVVFEMCIGLAIIGGCFTWIMSAISVLMVLMFIFTGNFYWYNFWMLVAGIVMMGGAGRGLGIDNWLQPALKNWWNGTKFGRKHHLYFDNPTK
ncbi:MAG: FAD-dependent oxidoreductase [Spirochaetaceae bacterium]|jgi:NADH dehydrogenase|nr:FAD-dependent oxidoreductase [Spirochaetaceae bacterium]